MLILLVTSPRVAPGLLTLQAWDTLRAAARGLAPPDHPQHAALRKPPVVLEADSDVVMQTLEAHMKIALPVG